MSRSKEPSALALLVAVLSEVALPDKNFSPRFVAQDAEELLRLGRSLSALAVAQCNVGLTPRQEARQANIQQEAANLAKRYGARAECGGDPRGFVLKLHLPTKRHNSWGGVESGWGVA